MFKYFSIWWNEIDKLNFLIIGEKPTKKKVEAAKEFKIKIIDQEQFLKMLNKTA